MLGEIIKRTYHSKGKWYCNQWKYIDVGEEDRSTKGPSNDNECHNRNKGIHQNKSS